MILTDGSIGALSNELASVIAVIAGSSRVGIVENTGRTDEFGDWDTIEGTAACEEWREEK